MLHEIPDGYFMNTSACQRGYPLKPRTVKPFILSSTNFTYKKAQVELALFYLFYFNVSLNSSRCLVPLLLL